jgi:hypothetical protein
LMRRVAEILVASTRRTGYEHPNLRAAFSNYLTLLQTMGWSEDQIRDVVENLQDGGAPGSAAR